MSKNYTRYLFYKGLEMLAYAIPLGALVAVNRDTYFKSGVAVSFWAYVVALFVVIAFKQKISEYAKRDVMVTVSLTVFLVAVIMHYVSGQLIIISACSLGGCVLSKLFTPVSAVYFKASRKADPTTKELVKIRLEPIPHRRAWVMGYVGSEVTNGTV